MRHFQRTIFVSVILLGLVFAGIAFAQFVNIPSKPQGYVSDYANLLSAADRSKIVRYAQELDRKTTAQLAVVTVPSTKPEEISRFSVRLYDKWKIGQAGKDNGVLILVAVKDRKAWITTGYGLEGALPDVVCSKIVNSVMVPKFKMGNYSQGILEGSIVVVSLISKEYNAQITGQEAAHYEMVHRKPSLISQIFYILFILFALFFRMGFLPWFLIGTMGRRRGGYWYGTGLGGSSGGFSGGFGGFGGGMTGGGGGGGGW